MTFNAELPASPDTSVMGFTKWKRPFDLANALAKRRWTLSARNGFVEAWPMQNGLRGKPGAYA